MKSNTMTGREDELIEENKKLWAENQILKTEVKALEKFVDRLKEENQLLSEIREKI